MKLSVIPCRKCGEFPTKEELLIFGAQDGNICYSNKHYDKIRDEPLDKTQKRVESTLKSGHHSIFEHSAVSLYLRDVPKILAMFLNNEKVYVTSEKSARYTKMVLTPEEQELYDKWMKKFQVIIGETYSKYAKIDATKTKKLAQENARYLTSVFTPTSMKHTLFFRQLSYVMNMFNDFVVTADNTPFNSRVKEAMLDFNQQLEQFYVEKLDPKMKKRELSLIASRKEFHEEFGESYCTTYNISFACLAQAHRHRTLKYQMQPIGVPDSFYVPPIIENRHELVEEWLDDLEKVKHNFPQATLLKVTERGTYEDFISKMNERLCGQAQLEIMRNTRITLDTYLNATETSHPEVHGELLNYANGPNCTFPGNKCKSPCAFGKGALERLV